jgi:hypothetical protein
MKTGKMNLPNLIFLMNIPFAFNLTGFRAVKMLSTESGFALSPQRWIDATNAVGIVSRSGRYGGTYAHEDN